MPTGSALHWVDPHLKMEALVKLWVCVCVSVSCLNVCSSVCVGVCVFVCVLCVYVGHSLSLLLLYPPVQISSQIKSSNYLSSYFTPFKTKKVMQSIPLKGSLACPQLKSLAHWTVVKTTSSLVWKAPQGFKDNLAKRLTDMEIILCWLQHCFSFFVWSSSASVHSALQLNLPHCGRRGLTWRSLPLRLGWQCKVNSQRVARLTFRPLHPPTPRHTCQAAGASHTHAPMRRNLQAGLGDGHLPGHSGGSGAPDRWEHMGVVQLKAHYWQQE